MKLAILLLCILVVISSVDSRRKWKQKRRQNASKYVGCKPEDMICDRRPKRFCRFRRFRYQCPRKCGECAPFNPKCPQEYKFGCCWDGSAANDIEKSNCPACSDVNEAICGRKSVKEDCDYASNSRITRFLCPVTCGACGDFGNLRAHFPSKVCEDVDQRCYKMKDTSCCKDNEILQQLCPKTCGICLHGWFP